VKMRVTWTAVVEVKASDFEAFEASTPEEVVANQLAWFNDGSGDIVETLSAAPNSDVSVELVER
jgi:hypothetical protein